MASEQEIRTQFDVAAKSGRRVLSENGFLRLLGVMEAQSTSGLSRQAVLDQSKLPHGDFDLLACSTPLSMIASRSRSAM